MVTQAAAWAGPAPVGPGVCVPVPGLDCPPGLALPYVFASLFSHRTPITLHVARKILFACLWFLSPRSPSHLTTPLPRGALGAPPNALTPWGLCAAGEPCGAAAAPSPEKGGPWCGMRGGRKALTLIHSWLEKRQHGVQSRNNIYPSTALNLFVSQGAQIFTLSVKETCTFSSGKYFYVWKAQRKFIFKLYWLQGRTCPRTTKIQWRGKLLLFLGSHHHLKLAGSKHKSQDCRIAGP